VTRENDNKKGKKKPWSDYEELVPRIGGKFAIF